MRGTSCPGQDEVAEQLTLSTRLDQLKRPETVLALAAALLAVFPMTASSRQVTDQTGRHVDIPDRPQRLVSLAPSITETVYALGLEDRLVGDTEYCDYPPAARSKPHVGAMLNPNLELVVALKPDLVLGTPEANRRETADRLERLGIPLYGVTARTLDETLRSIEDLGQVLGRQDRARELVGELRARIESVEKRVSGQPRPKVLFVVWYRPLITAGPQTFIADVVSHAGGTSISNDLRGEWPRMSLEEVVRRDPDVLLFPSAESFSPAREELERLPGWRELRAVQNHQMYFVSEAIMRQSPRLVDALEEVARILHPAKDLAPRRQG
jgi:iron complex transport system substrate-binding protein